MVFCPCFSCEIFSFVDSCLFLQTEKRPNVFLQQENGKFVVCYKHFVLPMGKIVSEEEPIQAQNFWKRQNFCVCWIRRLVGIDFFNSMSFCGCLVMYMCIFWSFRTIFFSSFQVKFRRDGYSWKRRRNNSKAPREDHMKLKVFGVEVRFLYLLPWFCWYFFACLGVCFSRMFERLSCLGNAPKACTM